MKSLRPSHKSVKTSSADHVTSRVETPRLVPRLLQAVKAEAKANFAAWVERNFKNGRAGRIGTTSYLRAGALDDHVGDKAWYKDAYVRAILDYQNPLTEDEFAYIVSHPLVAFQLAAGITDLRGLRCLRRGLTQRVNALQQKAYRARYYERDNARRRLLAAERRKIRRRTTTNPCPTPEAFRAAFAAVRESIEAKIRFGGMVHDLECYVDNCLRIDGAGNIVGRNGGIKAWIAANAPELAPRYKTIMRYKALVKRVRQAVGLTDPTPTEALLGNENYYTSNGRIGTIRPLVSNEKPGEGMEGNKIYYAMKSYDLRTETTKPKEKGMIHAPSKARDTAMTKAMAATTERAIDAARKKFRKLTEGCDNTLTSVFNRMDL